MATLISEDKECRSSLELVASGLMPETVQAEGERWQPIELILKSGAHMVSLGGKHSPAKTIATHDLSGPHTEPFDRCEASLVCRRPQDEIAKLVRLLTDLIEGRRAEVVFEPLEPSFELTFKQTPEGGFRVQSWIDAGNASTGIYSWDGLGIRFYTVSDHLASFVSQLQEEFLEPTGR